MSLFLSTFVNKIDRKGRVSVPATFRGTLAQQSFQGVVLFCSYTHAALEGCSMSRMEGLSKSVDQFDLFSENHEDLASVLFADAQQLAWDAEGRIILPEKFLTHAGIKESVSFVGRGTTFQIWDPKTFQEHQKQARQRIQEKRITVRLTEEAK